MNIDYKKYRWFYTSSGNLVIGGKSSSQNDELIKKLKAAKRNFIVMHTSSPGSPFSIILSNNATFKDKKECAIFTACFSKAWKQRKRKAKIDIFNLSQLYKIKGMKTGTWGVRGKVERVIVELSLVLTKQDNYLRAVPESAAKKILLKIVPGKIDKSLMLSKLAVELGNHKQDEILSALPPGGLKIIKND